MRRNWSSMLLWMRHSSHCRAMEDSSLALSQACCFCSTPRSAWMEKSHMVLLLGTAERYQVSENKNKVIYDESIETPIIGNLMEQQLPGEYPLQIEVPEGYKYAKEAVGRRGGGRSALLCGIRNSTCTN
ncbi:hypothetical protein KIL84_009628 [Mauremys mutica]|uniref:Uncharacterized protein n=1 Tax=Mauremys mutica TaxID=74926 RepID=A0A9D4B6C0_9SAUR|nr:hypothetical protein KIL84_009628 [Mauremys mutica]